MMMLFWELKHALLTGLGSIDIDRIAIVIGHNSMLMLMLTLTLPVHARIAVVLGRMRGMIAETAIEAPTVVLGDLRFSLEGLLGS